jgi:hypothetical protein
LKTADDLIPWLFEHAYSRTPTKQEFETARSVVAGADGSLTAKGVEDLLWMMVLSPEFQFIL